MYEILSNEKATVEKMTEEERAIYCQYDNNKIRAILAVNHPSVVYFSQVAMVLNELHRVHHRYNEVDENVLFADNLQTEQQSLVESLQYETFNTTLSVGSQAVVIDLMNMDDCDALYYFLSTVKMNAFYHMIENVDVAHLTYYMFDLNSD